MKNRLALLGIVALLAGCASTEMKEARSRWGDNPATNPDFMTEVMSLAEPGQAHMEMAKGVGRWNVSGKLFMAPGVPPEPMVGSANVRMALGGRYMIEEFKSEFMGEPFEGLMIMGFDNLTEEYTSIWMDNMSTTFALSRGEGQVDGDMDLAGEVKDLLTPSGRPFRMVTTHRSDSEYMVEMYDTMLDGEERKVMELVYTR